jgi:hypothetical protein
VVRKTLEELIRGKAAGWYPGMVRSSRLGLSFQRYDDKLMKWLISDLYNNIEIKLKRYYSEFRTC